MSDTSVSGYQGEGEFHENERNRGRKRRRTRSSRSRSSASEKYARYTHRRNASLFENNQLEEVNLSLEEEQDLEENYDVEEIEVPYFDSFGSSDNDSSSTSGRSAATGEQVIKVRKIVGKRPQIRLRSHQEKKDASKQSFPDFILNYSTSEWNKFPNKVYTHFNVCKYIVDPRHFLAISHAQDNPEFTMDRILKELETNSGDQPTWTSMKSQLESFLDIYKDFEDFPNHMNNSPEAIRMAENFRERLVLKSFRKYKPKANVELAFSAMELFADMLLISLKNNEIPSENLFVMYFVHLMDIFKMMTGLPLCVTPYELILKIPVHSRKVQMKKVTVKPDVIVGLKKIFLVGEVKKFGRHGVCHEEYRGSCPKQSGPCEPVPGSSAGPRDRDDAVVDDDGTHFSLWRCLGKREEYKVRCYLPQLLGQMFSAMQTNTENTKKLKLGRSNENVQLGLALEGFKLRLVKLVLRDDTRECGGGPSVDAFLSGVPFQCDVFLTQEFNLFKRKHIAMLFQMILAISHL